MLDTELRDALRCQDRQRLLALYFRRSTPQKEITLFHHHPFRRITTLPQAQLQIIELLKPDFSKVKIFWKDVLSLSPWYFETIQVNCELLETRASHRRLLKRLLLNEALDQCENKGTFALLDFKVFEIEKPRNREQRRKFKGFREPWSCEMVDMGCRDQFLRKGAF